MLPALVLAVLLPTTGWKNTLMVQTADVPIAVHEVGSGEPVLVLAGGPGLNSLILKDFVEETAKTNKCLVMDQRGTGDSALPFLNKNTLNLDRYLGDIEAVRTNYKLKKIRIVGHSWGAMLAMRYAAKYPERIENLMLVGAAPLDMEALERYGDNAEIRLSPQDLTDYQNAMEMGKRGDRDLAEVYALRAQWPAFFYDRKKALASREKIGPGFVRGGIDEIVLPQYFDALEDTKKGLRKLRAPVVIVQGRQDLVGEGTPFALRDIMRQSIIVYIERAGRFPWMEQPQATYAMTNAWFRSATANSIMDAYRSYRIR